MSRSEPSAAISLDGSLGRASMASSGKKSEERGSGLSSVATAMRLLKSFSEGEAEIGVTALAKRLGVSKSTAYRLASTLVAEGMLEQNKETEKYRLGIALFGLGALVRQRMNVSAESRQALMDLREATGETVRLAIRDGADVIYIYDLESHQAIRMRANPGDRKPVLSTAEGLAILAFAPHDVFDAVLAQGFRPRTPSSISDRAMLDDALSATRQSGFAIETEQCELGMRSVAAPIRDGAGQVAGAIGMAGPLQRLSDEVIASHARVVRQTADVISTRLGYVPGARE